MESTVREYFMNRFILKKLVVSGGGHEDSIIEFSEGLNVIIGPSNTGKSLMVDCIDYVFGYPFNKNKPSKIGDNNYGYTQVSLILETPEGEITFTRKIGSNKVNVESKIEGIRSGDYGVLNGELNKVYLNLLGIDGEHQVLRNQKRDTSKLTWRSILHLFLMKQEDIARTSSALKSPTPFNTTSSTAALLYLLTGRDFNDIEKPEDPEIVLAKKKAVMLYIRDKKDELSSRREKIQKELAQYDMATVNETIKEIKRSIETIQEMLGNTYSQRQEILSEINRQRDLLSECNVIISSFQNLGQQYESDVQRYEFIIEGKTILEGLGPVKQCPFCDSIIEHEPNPDHILAAKTELKKLYSNLLHLGETLEDAKRRKSSIEYELIKLQKKKTTIDHYIDNELKPQAEKFQIDLESNLKIIQLQQELEIIEADERGYSSDLSEKEKESGSELRPLKISDSYDTELVKSYEEELISILKKCKIGGASSARLNTLTFEIEIDNHSKSTCMGGGYCALLNTLAVYAMNSLIYKKGGYAPGFFIIDSPLTLLSEAESVEKNNSIKYNFINFFSSSSMDRQTIMVEQKDELPDLSSWKKTKQINVIEFTRDPAIGRYGFLNDVYNPEHSL